MVSVTPNQKVYREVLADLVDTAEIQARLGLKRPQIVHAWIRRDVGFPEPVKVFGASDSEKPYRVWSWQDISDWWAGWQMGNDPRRKHGATRTEDKKEKA